MLVDFPGDVHDGSPVIYPLSYLDHSHWHFRLAVTHDQAAANGKLPYRYLFEDENGSLTTDYCKNRFISLEKGKTDLVLLDSWVDMGSVSNVFHTAPFEHIFSVPRKVTKTGLIKAECCRFMVDAPMLPSDYQLGLLKNNEIL